MIELIWIIGITFLIAVLALLGIFTFILKEDIFNKLITLLVSFAAGAFIGAVFFEFLPEIFHEFGGHNGELIGPLLITFGFVFFFVLEEFLQWHHCHEPPCEHDSEETKEAFSYLILISNAIHNFVDGMIVGAAFLLAIPIGITTSIAIAAHEIPQELGNFGILVYGGWDKIKALLVNLGASLMIVPGGIAAYYAAPLIKPIYLIGFAAGSFLYIGAADLIPEVHGKADLKKSMITILVFLLGILIIVLVEMIAPHHH